MSNRSLAHGTGVVASARTRWETGIVRDYKAATRTYVVQLASGRQPLEMPRLVRDHGDTSIIPRDTCVVVHSELGFPVIDAILPQAPSNPVELAPTRVSEIRELDGEASPVASDDANFRGPNDPVDVAAGDRVIAGPEGNLLAILAGGTNVLKSSPFAQVRTHALTDMVEVLSKVYRHVTAMGNLDITSDGGKTSLIWRAGADQTTENGAGEENWTIRLDVGATGDLFNLEVTTPHGNTLSKVHLSADGRVEILGVNGIDLTSGGTGDSREDFAGDKNVRIGGSLSSSVGRDRYDETRGSFSSRVTHDLKRAVGGSSSQAVSGDDLSYVGGAHTSKTQKTRTTEVINGDLATILGNPASGALPSNQQKGLWVNHVGGYAFVIQPTALPGSAFSIISSAPGSVLLGADGAAVLNPATGTYSVVAAAPFGVMKYEPFAAMMQTMLTWMDTHVHASAVGPTSPPAVPASLSVSPVISPIRSVRVAVGL